MDRGSPMNQTGDVTRLLAAISGGDQAAWDALFPLVYERLQAIARRQLRGERTGHTLATGDLIHEAYFSLVGIESIGWTDRVHFMAMAARAMRRVLIDHARARATQKRGAGREQVKLNVDALADDVPDDRLLSLDEALDRLEAWNERYARIVECRFFAGMSIEDTAKALDISPATVKRGWLVARARLHNELSDEPDAG